MQLAKEQGAGSVIALAGGKAKCDLVLSLGADAAVDHQARTGRPRSEMSRKMASTRSTTLSAVR
nr:hypothetical protein [Mesorhizobium sp.]